jgi:hypothetical protein
MTTNLRLSNSIGISATDAPNPCRGRCTSGHLYGRHKTCNLSVNLVWWKRTLGFLVTRRNRLRAKPRSRSGDVEFGSHEAPVSQVPVRRSIARI